MQLLIGEANIDLSNVAPVSLPKLDPWLTKLPTVHLHLHSETKSLLSADTVKIGFHDFVSHIPHLTHVYIDGSKDSTGTASAAILGPTQTAARLSQGASVYSAELNAI